MATQQKIKETILKVAGNPISGVVYELAEEWAKAIADLDTPEAATIAQVATKETRITKPEEVR